MCLVWVGGGDNISGSEVQTVDLSVTQMYYFPQKIIQKYRLNLHLSSREEIITK